MSSPGIERAGPDAVPEPFGSLEHLLNWLPLDYDPDAFDAADVDLQLQAHRQAGHLLGKLRPELMGALLELDPSDARGSPPD